ncbi:MAG: circadian clock KaiB family protein [Streptomyces sp.]|uniref:circadian clock KaiB family protein n=1 Tax=Streptomyces sp. TaxID=1931 RepID=UPI003D6ABE1A
MAGYAFRLYVAGQSERSSAAEANLRALAGARLPGGYELEVVDVVAQPGLAEEQRILATPTVVRLMPLPQLRVIGDLSDPPRVANALGLPGGPREVREEMEADGGRHQEEVAGD